MQVCRKFIYAANILHIFVSKLKIAITYAENEMKKNIQLVKCHQSYYVNNLKHASIHSNLDKRSMEVFNVLNYA